MFMNVMKEVIIAMTTPHVQISTVHTTVPVIWVIQEMGRIVKVGLRNKILLGRCSRDICTFHARSSSALYS